MFFPTEDYITQKSKFQATGSNCLGRTSSVSNVPISLLKGLCERKLLLDLAAEESEGRKKRATLSFFKAKSFDCSTLGIDWPQPLKVIVQKWTVGIRCCQVPFSFLHNVSFVLYTESWFVCSDNSLTESWIRAWYVPKVDGHYPSHCFKDSLLSLICKFFRISLHKCNALWSYSSTLCPHPLFTYPGHPFPQKVPLLFCAFISFWSHVFNYGCPHKHV